MNRFQLLFTVIKIKQKIWGCDCITKVLAIQAWVPPAQSPGPTGSCTQCWGGRDGESGLASQQSS